MNNLNQTLPDLMRRYADHLEPESPDLVDRGIRRGIALRRRRTVLRGLGGATAALATAGIVIGGSHLLGGDPGVADGRVVDTGPTGATATPADPVVKPISPVITKDTLATLVSLLPPTLKLSHQQSFRQPGFDRAEVVVDDGLGLSQLAVEITPDDALPTCKGPQPGTCVHRPDGSVIVTSTDQPTPAGVLANSVAITRKGIGTVTFASFNATDGKAVKDRAKPAFTVAALTKFADNQVWWTPPKTRPTIVSAQQTLQTLRNLLPREVTVTRPESGSERSPYRNTASYVVNDGRGLSRIGVSVSYEVPVTKCSAEIVHCQVLAGGAVVGWSENVPEYTDSRQQLKGVVANQAELHYPDGRTITLTSLNGPDEKNTKHTRPEPAVGAKVLLDMAFSKNWQFPGIAVK
ncbi:hypothetical protein [Kribbella sp. NPDC055071]